jgi:hypothetical protein
MTATLRNNMTILKSVMVATVFCVTLKPLAAFFSKGSRQTVLGRVVQRLFF